MLYLSGACMASQASVLAAQGIGLMLQPKNGMLTYLEQHRFPGWAADNGCFAQGEQFTPLTFYRWLARVPRSRLLFVVAPDVFPDHAATVARATPFLKDLRADGYPTAFVAQNGADVMTVPWELFDCLFIGGTAPWKLGRPARQLVRHALQLGKRVHMGRVNSSRRLLYARLIGCHTADGTFLKFRNRLGPTRGLQEMDDWFRQGVFDGLHR